MAPLALRSVVEAEDELQTTDEEGDEEDDLLEGLKEEREKDDALKQHDRNKNEVNWWGPATALILINKR